jgi:polyhydroxyalkanoate synthase
VATKRKNLPSSGAQASNGALAPTSAKPQRNVREPLAVQPLTSAPVISRTARAVAATAEPMKAKRKPKAKAKAKAKAKVTAEAKAQAKPKPRATETVSTGPSPVGLVAEAVPYRVSVSVEVEPESAVEEMLGVAAAPLDTFDPAGFGRMLIETGREAAKNPLGLVGALAKFGVGFATASVASVGHALGKDTTGPVKPKPKDHRFADPTWQQNPAYFLALQLYLLGDQFAMQLIDAARLEPADDRKARFAAQFLLDAISPTHTLAGHPVALRTAFETGGKSLVRGTRNMLQDLRTNGGWPAQVDASGFAVGKNMAMTPGKVVYRNGLMELLEYAPQTTEVFEIPMLFCPPWINKYYIMDLAPGKSLIEWAVQHGHRCFAISYRNPDSSMRDVGFDDYLLGGPIDALRVVRAITGAPKVNTVSVCLGGQLTAMAMAYGAAIGDEPVNTATLINTHTDYTHAGALGLFADEESVARLERRMAKKGYLEATDMAKTFDALRANDLIFQYVVNNWLLGKAPPAFDLLAWNADSTRMTAKMHSRYLRSCYVDNEFSQGNFVANGVPLDPRAVTQPTYVLSAIDDHIVPWISAYKTTHVLGGESTFVLSTSGHIAGIVNPPSPKAKHWTNDALPRDPQQWLAGATLHDETWWKNWARWMTTHAGDHVAAPTAPGSAEYPPLGDAPGTYVRGRSR